MGFLTEQDIAENKAQGKRMNRLNCGWNLKPAELAEITRFIDAWEPKTETEKRDKHILELAFIQDMNASQIARLHDPLIVGIGNRNQNGPLSPGWIVKICYSYFPNLKRKRKPRADREQRNALYMERQKGQIKRQKSCATCGSRKDIELHHIIPIAAGGTNDYFNLVSLCHDCHMKLHHAIYDAINWKNSFPNNIE